MRNTWTIGVKLTAAFIAVGVITLLLGLSGYYGATQSQASITEIGSVRLPSVQAVMSIMDGRMTVTSAENALLCPKLDGAQRETQQNEFALALTQYSDARTLYESLPQTAEESTTWSEFKTAWERWEKGHDDYVQLLKEFQATDIQEPSTMERDIYRFRGDHFKVDLAAFNLISRGIEFKGGDDPSACNFGKWLATFKTSNPAITKLLDEIRPFHQNFHAGLGKIKALMSQGDKDGALALLNGETAASADKTFEKFDAILAEAGRARELYDRLTLQTVSTNAKAAQDVEASLTKLKNMSTTMASDGVTQSRKQAGLIKTISLVATITGAVSALLLGYFISCSINVALRRVAANLGSGADQTASAAGQVAQSSQAMAEGASQQASSLEETSASLEEMTSMTKQNAENAIQAKNLAATTTASADKGFEAMAKMSVAIDDIKKSSDSTAKIIKTIDEIAFQTNLLALNAAVEAARAGDAGKGFAVVAEEVRNLAQRSAEAAKNTSAMIEEAVQNANKGVQISQEVGDSLKEIAEAARKVNALVAEIASASNEQAQGIEQVSTAVAQMDQVTQANAANSEESASASEELSAQAGEMNKLVQELVAIVGANGSGAQHGNGVAHTAKKRVIQKSIAAPRSRRTPERAVALQDKQTVVKASDVIPLDDEDLKDF